jgi:hypothetical protein
MLWSCEGDGGGSIAAYQQMIMLPLSVAALGVQPVHHITGGQVIDFSHTLATGMSAQWVV